VGGSLLEQFTEVFCGGRKGPLVRVQGHNASVPLTGDWLSTVGLNQTADSSVDSNGD